MRITRLRLTDFKAHDTLEIEPAAGLTIVRGPNEAGKSTLQQAIELVLFRKADANREDIRQAWAWGSSAPPEVAVEFEVDGQTASLVKRFGAGRAEAELRLDGGTITDHNLIQEQVESLTGIPNEAFFRATASVSHAELDAVGTDEPVLHDRLQKVISGADRGTARAKKKLEMAIHRYRTEGQKNPGLLKVVREQIGRLEAEVATGEAALARLEADRAQWVEARGRREELETALRRQQADLAEAKRAADLARQRDEAVERYERLRRAAQLTAQGQQLQRDLPTTTPLAQLRSAVSRASSLRFEVSELEAEVSVAEEAGINVGPETTPPRPMRWLLLAAILVAAGWMASFLLSDAGALGLGVILALAAGVIVALAQAVRLARRRRQWGYAMQLAESAAVQRAETDRIQQEQSRRKRRELQSLLESIGVSDVEAAEELLARVQEQTESLARIEGELRGLGVEERNLRRLDEARDQAANEAERANHALAAMGSLGSDAVAAQGVAERQVAQTLPARDRARSEEDQAQGRVDANQVDAELVASLAERLTAARERYAELERRLSVYQGTLAAIEAAERATLKTAARYLEEHMGPVIATITDGRYDEIEVDEQSLAFRVRAPETGELVGVEQLSQGTADQLFLAARLGLVRLVTMDRRPPLILDDPFVTFDAARAERALRIVKRFAAEHGFQVLYLTCSDRFDQLADELVVLSAPSGERVLSRPAPAAPQPAAVPSAGAHGQQPAEPAGPILTFAPDPRPNPDPVAPRRTAEPAASPRLDFGPDAPRPAAVGPDTPGPLGVAPIASEPDVIEPSPFSGPAAHADLTPPARPAPGSEADEADPLAALRRAAEEAAAFERDTGVADPFRLAHRDDEGTAS